MADVFGPSISGENKWRTSNSRTKENMYQNEHDEMYVALRAGKPINNAEQAADSTRLAIMARMAAYTGSVITWDEALQSKEDLSPASYTWGDAPKRPVPVPGSVKLA